VKAKGSEARRRSSRLYLESGGDSLKAVSILGAEKEFTWMVRDAQVLALHVIS
jgi:hypothetical protein